MTNVKIDILNRLIPINIFNKCLIDNKDKKIIIERYPSRKNGAYYLNKFNNYLLDNYSLNLKEYCKKYLNIDWPKCPISGEEVGYRISGKGIQLSKFKKGRISRKFSVAFDIACKKMSIRRKGKNNPMFGKNPWNKGLSLEHPMIAQMAQKHKGKKLSEKSKQKMREARARHPLKIRHSQPHTKEVKEKMRIHTAKLWATGIFNRVSSIHIKTRDFLNSLNLKEQFQEEFQIKYFSLDFAFEKSKIGIECQGTYFHIDPRIYPNGPIDAIQRRNYGRDVAKKKWCDKIGWKIIEIWETEINDGTFKNILLCKLSQLNLLKK